MLPAGATALTRAMYGPLSVPVTVLARAMIRAALDDSAIFPPIAENRQIRTLGG